jgi:hypothetical protein
LVIWPLGFNRDWILVSGHVFRSTADTLTSSSDFYSNIFRAAMAAAGGKVMDVSSNGLQYLIREHMIENAPNKEEVRGLNNGILEEGEQLHLRWNSQKGTIFVDGSHLTHALELGDEVFIDANAPPLALFTQDN